MTGELALIGALAMTGLVSGITHCMGMCGPFVLGQTAARLGAVPAARMGEFHRLAGAALLPYHMGRMTTYAALGAVSAGLLGQVSAATGFSWLAGGALVIAASLLILAALGRLGLALPIRPSLPGALGGLPRALAASPTGWRGYGLGVLLGFLPCGLVYGALAAAAASADPAIGALAMAAFAAGTAPGLIMVGWLGQLTPRPWRAAIGRAAPVLFLANAGFVGWLAWRMLAA